MQSFAEFGSVPGVVLESENVQILRIIRQVLNISYQKNYYN